MTNAQCNQPGAWAMIVSKRSFDPKWPEFRRISPVYHLPLLDAARFDVTIRIGRLHVSR